MRDYHFTTIESIVADIPAYAVIMWVKLSGSINTVILPTWESWLLDHGWLILLMLRLVNIGYDIYLKVMYEDVIHDQSVSRESFTKKLSKKLRKLIP
jgi:hypothetical protein